MTVPESQYCRLTPSKPRACGAAWNDREPGALLATPLGEARHLETEQPMLQLASAVGPIAVAMAGQRPAASGPLPCRPRCAAAQREAALRGLGLVTFVWAAVRERMYWRYGERGYRYLFLDAGHVCQNLYLAGEALQCGVCALGAFDDDAIDQLLGLDGEDQFVIYAASVGKPDRA